MNLPQTHGKPLGRIIPYFISPDESVLPHFTADIRNYPQISIRSSIQGKYGAMRRPAWLTQPCFVSGTNSGIRGLRAAPAPGCVSIGCTPKRALA